MSNDLLERAREMVSGPYVEQVRELAAAYLELATHHASYCISPETYLALEARLRAAEAALTKCMTHLGGDALQEAMLARVAISEPVDPPPVANYKAVLATLDAAQARGTALMLENQTLHTENRRLKEAILQLGAGGGGQARACGYETERNVFCNLPAPRWFYKYANGKEIDLCAQHAREMRGSKER